MSPGYDSGGPVRCALKIFPGKEGELLAEITVWNQGTRTICIENRKLFRTEKLEGAQFFQVRRGEQRIPYMGVYVDRFSPTLNDLQLIHPGESVSASVALSPFYDFSLPGTYYITYDACGQVSEDGPIVEIRSNAVELKLSAN